MDNAEKKRESLKKLTIENSNKYNEKIYEIKQKQKAERKEKLEKIYSKLEKMNIQQQKFLESKLQVVKHEHEKITEINYLNQLEKENKDMSLKKKLDISTKRRNKYLQDRINKVNHRYRKTNDIAEDLKDSLVNKIETNNNSSILDVMEKKKNIENKIEFIKKVFNEDFIWELFEADYFDLDELSNLTSLTRFELEKSKLRKEKELIERLYSQKFKQRKNTSITTTNVNPTNNTGGTSTNINETLYEYDEFAYNKEEEYEDKHSRSFSYFNENDFLDIDYLFSNNKKKKNRKKKKKSKNTNDKEIDGDDEIRRKIMRQMNSISLTDLRKPQEIENENKMKKYLVKSESNGKYIQSRLIVAPEDLNVNTLNEQNNTNNNNNNNNNNLTSSPNKNQDISKKNSKEIESINKNSSNNTPSKGNEKENTIKKSSSTGSNNQKEIDKEKIFHGLIQASNLANSNPNNTITINDNNIANILENNQITIRWCKICNMIFPSSR